VQNLPKPTDRKYFETVTTLMPSIDIHGKFYEDCPRGTPSGGLNARRLAKYSDFDLSKVISRKWCKIGGKLVVSTNRKSHMSFQLVPKLVTLVLE